MPDYVGPLQRIVLSQTLWLVVAWPIVGFLWQALVARRRIARARGQTDMRRALASARTVGIACIALAAISTLAHAVLLMPAQGGDHALFEHVARGARFGNIDGDIDLLFDPLAAAFSGLACVIALCASVFLATSPPPARGWRTWAWLQLSLGGALVTFVADGFVGTALGWALAGAAGAWLAGWNHAGAWTIAAMRTAVAIAAMLIGAILLFWGLGGSWDGDEYLPDLQSHFSTVRIDSSEGDVAPGGPALTFTSLPGALVFVDEARIPSMRSPFVRVGVRTGTHALLVRPGDGSGDDVLGLVAFAEGDEIAVVPVGPTLRYRAIADQLVLRDAQGDNPVRNTLELRGGPGGATVVAASLVALLLAAFAMSGSLPSPEAPLALTAVSQCATTAALGPYLLMRVAFLFPLAPNTWVAVESVGAAMLLVAGWRAPAAAGMDRWLGFLGVVPAAIACLALGAAGVTTATFVMLVSGTATAAVFLWAGLSGPSRSQRVPVRHGAAADLLLLRAPARLGELLIGMDRWVVDGIAGAIGALSRAGAWVIAKSDERLFATPANVVADRMVRIARGVEPVVGIKLSRLTWGILAAVALAVLAHALRSGR
jgi:hypothetical protein